MKCISRHCHLIELKVKFVGHKNYIMSSTVPPISMLVMPVYNLLQPDLSEAKQDTAEIPVAAIREAGENFHGHS